MLPGSRRSEVMLEVDDKVCHVCRKCLARDVCRGKAIRIIDRGEAPFLDMSRCWGCMDCLVACPFGAIIRHETNLGSAV